MAEIDSKPSGTTSDKYLLRLHDEGLRKQLKVRAAMNERTLNAEILYLIKRGIEAESRQQEVAA